MNNICHGRTRPDFYGNPVPILVERFRGKVRREDMKFNDKLKIYRRWKAFN